MIDELYPLCQPTTPLPAALRAGVAQARRIAAGDRMCSPAPESTPAPVTGSSSPDRRGRPLNAQTARLRFKVLIPERRHHSPVSRQQRRSAEGSD